MTEKAMDCVRSTDLGARNDCLGWLFARPLNGGYGRMRTCAPRHNLPVCGPAELDRQSTEADIRNGMDITQSRRLKGPLSVT